MLQQLCMNWSEKKITTVQNLFFFPNPKKEISRHSSLHKTWKDIIKKKIRSMHSSPIYFWPTGEGTKKSSSSGSGWLLYLFITIEGRRRDVLVSPFPLFSPNIYCHQNFPSLFFPSIDNMLKASRFLTAKLHVVFMWSFRACLSVCILIMAGSHF